ncbi:hypothetical protein [Clostridium hydrogeniformans]|nr:hypothetical protein [Clostridium hydrogeniformans]
MLNNLFLKLFSSEEVKTVDEEINKLTEEEKLDREVAEIFQRMQIGNS